MPRPQKIRRVGFMPDATHFKPAGIRLRLMKEVCLSIEEAEAVRLKDLECLEQEEAAKKMNISRPTFQRILISARHKVADALLNGKAIRINGGNFEMAIRHFRCIHGHKWETSEAMAESATQLCPTCNTPSIPFRLAEPSWSPGRRHRGKGFNR
jgi:predicted DNA-binding protein (UPF0251 family)